MRDPRHYPSESAIVFSKCSLVLSCAADDHGQRGPPDLLNEVCERFAYLSALRMTPTGGVHQIISTKCGRVSPVYRRELPLRAPPPSAGPGRSAGTRDMSCTAVGGSNPGDCNLKAGWGASTNDGNNDERITFAPHPHFGALRRDSV